MRPNFKLKRNQEILHLFNEGNSSVEIAKKFKISKQRVNQILNYFGIEPRKISQDSRKIKLKKVKMLYDEGVNIKKLLSRFNMTKHEIEIFKEKYDPNFSIRKQIQENNKKRDEKVYRLYKSGLTGSQILKMFPEFETINNIYRYVCNANNGHLPKRTSTYIKYSKDLTSKIIKLKRKHSFREVHKILLNDKTKNSNNQPIKLETVINRYYKKNSR